MYLGERFIVSPQDQGILLMTISDKPNSSNQKYIATQYKEDEGYIKKYEE